MMFIHLNKPKIALSFPYPSLVLVYMYCMHTRIDIGYYNCGRFKEIMADLLLYNGNHESKYLVFNYDRNFGPMGFEIYLPEKKSACKFGPVGFEIHLPEPRIHLPWLTHTDIYYKLYLLFTRAS